MSRSPVPLSTPCQCGEEPCICHLVDLIVKLRDAMRSQVWICHADGKWITGRVEPERLSSPYECLAAE